MNLNVIISIMFKFVFFAIGLLGSLVISLAVNFTTPSNLGPFGVLIVFGAIYLVCLSFLAFLLYFLSATIARLSRILAFSKKYNGFSFRYSYYLSTVLASAPVMLIALQSVGSVGYYEIALVFIFLFIGILFISKKKIKL